MLIKIFLKKVIPLIVAVVMAVTLTGCFDLGDFESEEDYYNSFGDVRLVYQNPESTDKDVDTEDYSVRDYFYNGNTGNDFEYGDPDDDESDEGKDIPSLPYVYMALPIEDDVEIDSIALFFKSSVSGLLKIELYLVDVLPNDGDFTNVKLFGDPERQKKLDENGDPVLDEEGNPILEPVVYDDPSQEKLVASENVYLNAEVWDSMLVDRFAGENTLQVKDKQFILLKFVNNGGFKAEDDLSIPFKTTNLLVRAVS